MPIGMFVFIGVFVAVIMTLSMWLGVNRTRRIVLKWARRGGYEVRAFQSTGGMGSQAVFFLRLRDAAGVTRTARVTFAGVFITEGNLRCDWLEGTGPFPPDA